jgi:hypothetical protein
LTTPSARIFPDEPARVAGTTWSIGAGVSASSRTVAVFAPRSSSTRAASPALPEPWPSTLPTRISVMMAAVSK